MQESKIYSDLLLIDGHAKNMRNFSNADSVDVVYSGSYSQKDLKCLADYINKKGSHVTRTSLKVSGLVVYMGNVSIKIYSLYPGCLLHDSVLSSFFILASITILSLFRSA